jgi:hypothetical protein
VKTIFFFFSTFVSSYLFIHPAENKYASLVRGIIGNNVELAEMFVHCLFDRDLWREAQVWMEIFGIDSPELVKQLRRYQAMEGLFAGSVSRASFFHSFTNSTTDKQGKKYRFIFN